jgi:glutathione S-transferase kappa 1
MKDLLTATTQEALDRGAFGAPWLWVTNEEGKSEPFFGSDRFHFVYQYLGLPFQDITLLAPGETSTSAKL